MLSVRRVAGLSRRVTMWRLKKLGAQIGSAVSDHLYLPTSKPDAAKNVHYQLVSQSKGIESPPGELQEHSVQFHSVTQIFTSPEWRSLQFV
ncbi:hypothetical protein RR48_01960 [Papilio machaon]|uniref:Uncharacterized protein n=1 Tax=Papilio machaon TaxID=76193 RepID=A0A0N0PCS3_PAPMA|nr:hypothetical protein RR48_01960 [Papilio machaon]